MPDMLLLPDAAVSNSPAPQQAISDHSLPNDPFSSHVTLLLSNLEAAANAMETKRDESLCKYNGGSCQNKRAFRSLKHGPLRLCEYHQRRANTYQKRYLQRHKTQRRPPPAIKAEPVTPPVPPAAVTAPFVVFVFARETNIAESLLRLTSAGECVGTGQPLSAVACESRDQLVGLLRRGGGANTAVQLQSSVAMPTTTAPAREYSETIHTHVLNPLPVLPSTDTESSLSQDDTDWLSSLLDE